MNRAARSVQNKETSMTIASRVPADLVEELRLRRWARENYIALERRDLSWHPVVLDEMLRKDQELASAGSFVEAAPRIVPLAPDRAPTLRGPHVESIRSSVLVRIPAVE